MQRRPGTRAAGAQIQPNLGRIQAEDGAQLDDVAAGQASQRLQSQPQIGQPVMGSLYDQWASQQLASMRVNGLVVLRGGSGEYVVGGGGATERKITQRSFVEWVALNV